MGFTTETQKFETCQETSKWSGSDQVLISDDLNIHEHSTFYRAGKNNTPRIRMKSAPNHSPSTTHEDNVHVPPPGPDAGHSQVFLSIGINHNLSLIKHKLIIRQQLGLDLLWAPSYARPKRAS